MPSEDITNTLKESYNRRYLKNAEDTSEMPHKATKVNQGEYHYRGFFIEQRETREWFIGDVRDYIAHDVTDTLREAKDLVDYYLSK